MSVILDTVLDGRRSPKGFAGTRAHSSFPTCTMGSSGTCRVTTARPECSTCRLSRQGWGGAPTARSTSYRCWTGN